MNNVTITKFTTFWKLPKLEKSKYFKLMDFLSTKDYYTKERIPYGYFENDLVYKFPLISETRLLKLLEPLDWIKFDVVEMNPFPYKNFKRDIMMKNPPKDKVQEECIEKVYDQFTLKKQNRAIVSLKAGQGKTYVAVNLMSKLKLKTIIFVKSLLLKDQWTSSILTHTDCKNFFVIKGTQDLLDLLDTPNIDYDVYICTHRTMSNFIQQTSLKDLGKLFIQLGIGFKVYDEFDLENSSMFTIDCNTAIRCNLYLSATPFKSSSDEDKIFRAIFEDVPNIGPEYAPKIERKARFILYNTKPTKKEFYQCQVYTVDGPVFNYHKYHEYVVKKKAYKDILKDMWEKVLKNTYENGLKTVFFIGRINTSEEFRKDLIEITGLSNKEISICNSETDPKFRDWALSRKLIISTSDSLGRGIDLKGLDTIVDLETRNSLSETTQLVGRVSRTGMSTVGTYFQFVDVGFPITNKNYFKKKREGYYEKEFTDIKEIVIE